LFIYNNRRLQRVNIYISSVTINVDARDVILVFSSGGQNFDRLPRGAKNEEKKHVACKNTKVTIFQIQGGQMPHSQMTSLVDACGKKLF